MGRLTKDCQCLGFLTCTHMVMQVIAHGVCTHTVGCTESRLLGKKNPLEHLGIKPASILRLAFRSAALSRELFLTGGDIPQQLLAPKRQRAFVFMRNIWVNPDLQCENQEGHATMLTRQLDVVMSMTPLHTTSLSLIAP